MSSLLQSVQPWQSVCKVEFAFSIFSTYIRARMLTHIRHHKTWHTSVTQTDRWNSTKQDSLLQSVQPWQSVCKVEFACSIFSTYIRAANFIQIFRVTWINRELLFVPEETTLRVLILIAFASNCIPQETFTSDSFPFSSQWLFQPFIEFE